MYAHWKLGTNKNHTYTKRPRMLRETLKTISQISKKCEVRNYTENNAKLLLNTSNTHAQNPPSLRKKHLEFRISVLHVLHIMSSYELEKYHVRFNQESFLQLFYNEAA